MKMKYQFTMKRWLIRAAEYQVLVDTEDVDVQETLIMAEAATHQFSSYNSTSSSPYIYDSTDHSYVPREKKPRYNRLSDDVSCIGLQYIHMCTFHLCLKVPCPSWSIGGCSSLLLRPLSLWMDKPRVVCDAWPVRRHTYGYLFPAAERHRPLAGINLYCLRQRHMGVNNLPRVVAWRGIEPTTAWSQVQRPDR